MKIAILGAGISGLAMGYYLKKKYPNHEISIFEKSNRVGGLIESSLNKSVLFNWGPKGFRPQKKGKVVLELIQELGLLEEIICANKAAKKRYLCLENKLHRLSPVSKVILGGLFKDIFCKPYTGPEETIAEFGVRHFGTAFTETILQPLISGIWAGDIQTLGMDAALPFFKELDQKSGSIIKGLITYKTPPYTELKFPKDITSAALISFKNGIDTLTKALGKTLQNHIYFNKKIIRITKENALIFDGGQEEKFDKIISTLPAYTLATILNIEKLNRIPYSPLAIVNFGFDQKVNPHKGFGYLVPHPNKNYLGCLFNDQVFPQQHNTGSNLTMMIGGARATDFHTYTKEDFIQIAKDKIKIHLQIKTEPEVEECRLILKAIPQYLLGHKDLITDIRTELPPNFYLSGNFIDGVSIIDIINNAKKLVDTNF